MTLYNATFKSAEGDNIGEVKGKLIYRDGLFSTGTANVGFFNAQFIVQRSSDYVMSNRWEPGMTVVVDGREFNVDSVKKNNLYSSALCILELSGGINA